MSMDPDPTTEKILRDGDELLDSSQQLLRDLDKTLADGRRLTAPEGDGTA